MRQKKVRQPADRTAYYRIEDDAWQKVIQRKIESLSSFGEIADEGLALAGGEGHRAERIRAAHDSLTWLRDLADRNPLKS